MNINLNNISIFPFSPVSKPLHQVNSKYPNLAPLTKDTVSFSGQRRLEGENMVYAPSDKICRQVELNAEPARFYLETVLNKYLKPLTQPSDKSDNPDMPILKCVTRTKTSTSIREKVAAKYGELVKQESKRKYYNPQSIEGIKHYARDIVGARVVLRKSDPDSTVKVLDALKQAVLDGKLKITSIENYLPNSEKMPAGKKISDYEYARTEQLESLADAAGAKLKNKESKTGYMAIHINLDLSNNPLFHEYNSNFNDYHGEIQIIGKDVEKLKDTEDLCYKIKDNKNPTKAEYKRFKDYFKKYYTEDTKKAFDDYTYALYLAQRDVPPDAKKSGKFPDIAQLGFKDKVPPELDFNKLKKIKDICDDEIKINDEFDKLSEQDKSVNETIKSSIRKENIIAAKRVIKKMFR